MVFQLLHIAQIIIGKGISASSIGEIRKERTDQIRLEGQTHVNWEVLARYIQIYSGWFKGLSHVFLNIHLPKILLTAEKERLDKELTIAQMQGKFKLVVIHNVGHSVQ